MPPLNLADFAGGAMFLLAGVLAAVAHVRAGGVGQVVDASILDGCASLLTLVYGLRGQGLWSDERGANLLDGGCPFGRTYRTADGLFMAAYCLEPSFYTEMLGVLGLNSQDLPQQHDRAGWPMLHARFEAAFLTRTRAEWTVLFQDCDACVTPVLNFSEAPKHPHNIARGVFVGAEAPIPASAPRFYGTPTAHAPQFGRPAEQLIKEWTSGRAKLAATK